MQYTKDLLNGTSKPLEEPTTTTPEPSLALPQQSEPEFPDDFTVTEAEEAYPILGNVTGIGAEIGTGIYLTKKLHRSQQFMKWAGRAKNVSVAATVTPEPTSTIGGLIGFGLSEAAIWGGSNLLGQGIRKQFGVQDNISTGEALASSVFGVGFVTKGGQKLLQLGDGLAAMKSWKKGQDFMVNGAKSFVSGAVMGLAETALRQEVQIMLDERENREAVEYLIGGLAGGGFNTMFDVFSRTGKWGQAKASDVTTKAQNSLLKQASELRERAASGNPRAAASLRREAAKLERAADAVSDLNGQLSEAAKNLDNQAPAPKEAPVEAPKAPVEGAEVNLKSRQEHIDELVKTAEGADKESMSKVLPQVVRSSRKIYDEIYGEFDDNVSRLIDNADDAEATANLLKGVKEIRDLNNRVKNVAETTGGRILQASRKDADNYSWLEVTSLKSRREDAALERLENFLAKGGRLADDVEVPTKPKQNSKTSKVDSEGADIAEIADSIVEGKATKLDPEEYRAELFRNIESSIYRAIEADGASNTTKFIRFLRQNRTLSLINQIPSALAGVPTGVVGVIREVNLGVVDYMKGLKGGGVAYKMGAGDLKESLSVFGELFSADTYKAAWRTAKRNQSFTDGSQVGRITEDMGGRLPRGEAALVARARRKAEKALEAKDRLLGRLDFDDAAQKAGRDNAVAELSAIEKMGHNILMFQSMGVRAIQGLDEVFKRSMIHARIRKSARREALMDLEASSVDYTDLDIDKLTKQKFDSAFRDSNGLTALKAHHDYIEEVDGVRRELLFAANSDNIAEVVTPVSETMIKGIQGVTNDDTIGAVIGNFIMPFVGVPIRSVAKGFNVAVSPVDMAFGAIFRKGNSATNPYIRKVNDAKKELEAALGEMGDLKYFDESVKGKTETKVSANTIRDIEARIQRHEARRIQFNSDKMADVILNTQLVGLAATGAYFGSATGSLNYMTREEQEKRGLKPYTLFGMDYKAIGPAAMPLNLAADVIGYIRIKELEMQTGQKILKEDISLKQVIVKSLGALVLDQPLSQGAKQVQDMIFSDFDTASRKMAQQLYAYTNIQGAGLKKLTQMITSDGKVVDSKELTTKEKVAQNVFGISGSIFKTDRFGNDLQEPRGWHQQLIMRQLPRFSDKAQSLLEEVFAGDHNKKLDNKPQNLTTGIRLKDFRTPEGMPLSYQFDIQLRETRIKGKSFVETIEKLIMNDTWLNKWERGQVNKGGQVIDPAYMELNKIIKKFYDKAKADLLADNALIKTFYNEKEQNLWELMNDTKNGDFTPTGKPVNLDDIL